MRHPCLRRHGESFVADDATVIGDVSLGIDTSIWYGTVVRGDVAPIGIGRETNIQDLCVVHPQTDEEIEIGEGITIGHGVIFHGRRLGSRCLVGMGAIIMRGVLVGEDCIIGAGSLLTEDLEVPDGSVVMGNPGKIVRSITAAERERIRAAAATYVKLARSHHP
jgi:carbonic anhydrase/acetyltransferase-like protein (isoleucine patch superfamily)